MQRRSQYRILGRVGTGQFGQVFCAMHRHTGEIVALKQLDARQFPTHRFLRELHVLARLQHPNVVSLHTLEYNPGGRYLVMDYCEAGTLRDLINTPESLNARLSLGLIQDILQGLAHAHDAGVIHCDLKPENILLTLTPEGWRARIADFGIARLQDGEGRLEQGGNTGSPAYMAPERFYGRCPLASDLYAVGVILYELIMGDRPFDGVPADLMAAHMNRNAELPTQIPFLIRSVISKALQKLPQNRYTSAADMLDAVRLAAAVLDAAISTPDGRLPRLSRFPTPLPCVTTCFLPSPIRHLVVQGAALLVTTATQMQWRSICANGLGAVIPGGEAAAVWPVAQLHAILPGASGLLVVTRKTDPQNPAGVETALHWLSELSDLPGSALPAPFYRLPAEVAPEHIALDPTGKWVAIYEGAASRGVQLLHLPTGQPLRRFDLEKSPRQLLALDRRYGLGLMAAPKKAQTDLDQTQLQWFNRRGFWGSSPALAAKVDWVVVRSLASSENTRQPQSTLFAWEDCDSPQGLLITLTPLRVRRVDLSIRPQRGLAASWGYVLISAQGEMLLLDATGQVRGHYDLALEAQATITAVALVDPYGLVVATQLASQGCLQYFELPAERLQADWFGDVELQDCNLTQPEALTPLSVAVG
ncbi:protein kinase [Synechococcales cyanobacterium C]|uniref:Protein kinase n=1 Tax=Petrachloros mirabilis ULC683 TaxID=2781853 RepID=A0A8K2A861_9CYAN|nr:serine/threonine-protein kinase [Petrachloros mirabilis]NCJ07669.1 protein kinase [Petrachloros mirabilis ULC683]